MYSSSRSLVYLPFWFNIFFLNKKLKVDQTWQGEGFVEHLVNKNPDAAEVELQEGNQDRHQPHRSRLLLLRFRSKPVCFAENSPGRNLRAVVLVAAD